MPGGLTIPGRKDTDMDAQKIINTIINMIKREAFAARILEELYFLEYDRTMMAFYKNMALGKAFAAVELYNRATNDCAESDKIYHAAVESATRAIDRASNNIIELLNLAGFDGEAHYAATMKHQVCAV